MGANKKVASEICLSLDFEGKEDIYRDMLRNFKMILENITTKIIKLFTKDERENCIQIFRYNSCR
jgi:hypothetical protein